MSILSSVTGIGINPFGKRKLKIDPLKALGTAATLATMGGAGPLAGVAGKIGSVASHIPGAAKVGAGVSAVRRVLGGGGGGGGVPQVVRNGMPISINDVLSGGGAPAGGVAPGTPAPDGGGGTDWLSLAEGGLAGLSAVNAAQASGRAGKYQDAALAHANERWQQGAQLRAAGQQRLLNPVRPDLTSVFNDPNNAFSRPAPPNAASPLSVRRRLTGAPA